MLRDLKKKWGGINKNITYKYNLIYQINLLSEKEKNWNIQYTLASK